MITRWLDSDLDATLEQPFCAVKFPLVMVMVITSVLVDS